MRRFMYMTHGWDPVGVVVRMRETDAGYVVDVSFVENGYRPTYQGGGTYPATNKEKALATYRRLLNHYKAKGYRIAREPNLRAM